MSAAPTLVLRDLRKRFADATAVDGVSFAVRPGSIFGLLGRNGAGKTTTLRMIAGIFYPDSGTIEAFGQPWSTALRGRMSYLPEERGLYRKMRVSEHVQFFAEIKGVRGSEAEAAVGSVLRRFQLWDDRARRVEELSKGNQQKVQLAGVLVSNPDLLLLDEPMSGLDPVNVILVREILQELKAAGKTIVLSTHMMSEAERLCDEVCLIHRGKAVLSGPTHEVRSSRGRNVVHLTYEGVIKFGNLPGVERTEATNRTAELHLVETVDTNALLTELLAQARILRFEVASPSLEEIFVAQVGERREEGALP